MLKTGTVVDASIITAPSSTKNKDGQRDPEMHQTKKGNQWHFGMKVHIGVDAQSGLVHSVIGTATTVNDVTQASAQLHGDEEVVFADSGYHDAHNRPEAKPGVTLNIARRPSSRKRCEKSGLLGELIDKAEHLKASVRRQGGAPISCHQAAVWLRQDALPRPGQEHGAAGDDVCAEQFVDGAPPASDSAGMSAPAARRRPQRGSKSR